MSNMSSRISNHSQNPKDIQGGDKKVMKKSLSVILSTAMALSVFSSVAFAAKADDFSDLKDLDAATKAKFDSMIQAGIFDGVEEGRFGLNDKMNRAQFAKVAALIFELKSSATTSSFEDVKSSDPANGYALPYIEALRVAGITDGKAEGKYVPAGDVTKEELATFLIRGLGKESEALAKPGVSDKTVSDWAKGYVQLAQELKLFEAPAGQPFNGTTAATRDLLVTSSYQAQQLSNASKKLSVSEAKATGVKTVTVKFNREVDTAKASLALKKGTASVATDVKWADDKKSAVLTLTNSKLSAGAYSVTLSGLAAETVDKAVAEFSAEDEKLTKIEFLNPSDTIAYSKNVMIKVAATNQYGEAASLPAGSYTVYAGNNNDVVKRITKADDGSLRLILDTTVNDNLYKQGYGVVAVNIIENDSRVSVNKTFKVGTQPIITKSELGAVKYSNGDALSAKGQTATVEFLRYDQYGNLVAADDSENYDQTVTRFFSEYEKNLKTEVVKVGNEGLLNIKVSLLDNVAKSGTYTLNVQTQASFSTAKINVKSSKVATKVKLGDASKEISEGDDEAFIDLTAFDVDGNQLSADDIVNSLKFGQSNSNDNTVNLSTSTGNIEIVQSGDKKGKIRLSNFQATDKSVISVSIVLTSPGLNAFDTKTYNVKGARIASTLKLTNDPAKKALPGATADIELNVLDQFDSKLDKAAVTSDVYVQVSFTANGTGIGLYADGDTTTAITTPKKYQADKLKDFNEGFDVIVDAAANNANTNLTGTFKAELINSKGNVLASVTKDVKVIDKNSDLSYTVTPVTDLYAAVDKLSGDQEDITKSALRKKVKITAKDNAGDTVALPSNVITSIATYNDSVVKAEVVGGTPYVLGNKVGSTTVAVGYNTAKGEQKTASISINVKDEAVQVAKVVADNDKDTFVKTSPKTAQALLKLTVTDNYGVEYGNAVIAANNNILGVIYTATDIQGGGSVTISTDGTINISGTVTSFTLTANANGKSDSAVITVQ
ncbi:S-layer homology domain-containing protein [Paenibacillus sp. UNC499MF]|uniref:S-layer homology domain-containing protein n=1 Tax=Paenibacillus sp. UNC499MF TaxID=1502751 RepID=UPI00089F86E3|nr:S-layer homology domain-containing protein [Paenibacillus sp. UNC499MF]SEG61988.1 S-layer homology domain-containing protein [Paenibacillus sp. UNC499MF]